MLAPTHDFGYSPAVSHHHQQQQHNNGSGYEHHHHHAQQQPQLHSMVQQHHSGERPKLFALDAHHLPHGMHALVHHDNGESFHPMATPQHNNHSHHATNDFDHEPLLMSLHQQQQHNHHHANAAAAHYYAPMGHQLLHVSSDYPPPPASASNSTPSASTSDTKKRSREDLNMKEKKRMFKLNDRINQLKELLDDAGVASKKSKQSILDNTVHYISMLQSNLLIAQQKAERAEKQTDVLRTQAQASHNTLNSPDSVFKRCFDQSTTARLITDVALQPVTYNHAFAQSTGLGPQQLTQRDVLRTFLCQDAAQLDRIVDATRASRQVTRATVQARTVDSDSTTLTLLVAPIADDNGNVQSLEFSLVPSSRARASTPLASTASAIVSPAASSASTVSSASFTHSETTVPKRELHDASPSGIADLAV